MPHTYVSGLVHCVFSTKNREDTIVPGIRERLWAFMGGICRRNKMKALAIGGTSNHVHVLISLPATLSLAKAVQLIKGASSKWVHETSPNQRNFAWQEGYGAFSVSISHVQATIEYVESQEAHHRRKTFEAEFLAFLKKHSIGYDLRYVWG
jgi:REP element-mobilizing transposase RayT